MLFRTITPEDEAALADLFAALVAAGDERFFHPHPLTPAAAHEICGRREATGEGHHDEYHVAIEPAASSLAIVGYGILRGWAEGFAIPSLGIAIHPRHRGRGIARAFMEHLHAVAADRGAAQVRLKVYRSNTAARRLYESLAYEFQPWSESELVGFRTVRPLAIA